ncbi:MAG: methyltransferase domain-containing protein [Rhodocyclaceae bacterium]|nr:methyltransferase domain-containing protein [Rhodocyclaceae bacterium]
MRKAFSAAATRYDEAAVLAHAVGQRMLEKLAWMRVAPQRMLDVGCATGEGIWTLTRRYPDAIPVAADYALPMLLNLREKTTWRDRWRRRVPLCVNADVRALPFAPHSFGLIWSNLMLHWLDAEDLVKALHELRRALAPHGVFLFSALGPDTLKSLRTSLMETGGTDSMRRFLDMHDIGDALVEAGFADPVMEMEMITLTYASARPFLADLRRLGVRDGLLGRQSWRQWRAAFRTWQARAQPLAAVFEIVYGHAWHAEGKSPPAKGGHPLRFMPYRPKIK